MARAIATLLSKKTSRVPKPTREAKMLVRMIQDLDAMVFTKRKIRAYYSHTRDLEQAGSYAAYVGIRKWRLEAYIVRPNILVQHIDRHRVATPRIFRDSKSSHPNRKEFLAAVAVHEVRHRIQTHFRGTFRPFSLEGTNRLRNKSARDFIEFMDKLWKDPYLMNIKNRKQRGDEFDAKMVEILALNLWRSSDSFRKLKSIVWAQPRHLAKRPS